MAVTQAASFSKSHTGRKTGQRGFLRSWAGNLQACLGKPAKDLTPFFFAKNMKMRLILLAMASAVVLGGCAATQVAISKRDLDVQTKMSASIFLDPVAPDKRTVFVQIRNTSDKKLDIASAIDTAITDQGYRVVTDLAKAHYMLQTSILKVGKIDPSAAQQFLAGGFGGALAGGGAGVALAALSNNNNAASYGGFGLLGAVIGTVADAAVKDVMYTMVTDLQVSERAPKGVVVNQNTNSHLSQGTSTSVTQESSSKTSWKRYRTRIVSTAEKVNLHFKDARQALEHGLIRSISGIF